MSFKAKLTQFQTEWEKLLTKIRTKLANDRKTITETTQKLQAANHKLELQAKEQVENEAVLETLLKEFKELEGEL